MHLLSISLYAKRLVKKQWLRVGVGLIVLAILMIWHPVAIAPAHAQLDSSSSFRLSRIETDIRTLQSEIQQLETALDRVARRSGDTVIIQDITPDPANGASASPTPLDVEAAQSELMFDQLATLVIETRQDMFALQEKVETLEQSITP